MKRSLPYVFVLLLLSGVSLATTRLKAESSPTVKQQDAVSQSHTIQTNGEEVFKANCSRCHMPPMGLSPRTTGAVVMHMRARARLSRQDEKLLLKYLAP
jgi:mono/diheme cytochrome c family protein